ncbi:hypothetical protein GH714_031917 [Hevea brasiliensis]|uniref:HECT-type E3 ubiquitin transferase n=1 Tax=Hevea brasiliensis TaxID=3981 RepID=A0A6A6LM08_HEVBR|nr:hypothetical protein GH714_031917 [Hevea brasiliensis]
METRSRKRAEASSTAPSSSSSGPTTRSRKRSRLTAATTTSSSTSTAATATAPSIAVATARTRSTRPTRAHPAPMDSTTPVESSSRSRRNKNESSDKGKEKEHEVRVRDNRDVRDRERDSSGLNMESGNNNPNDDDDNDSEGGGIGTFHQNLTSASSALQGLLRKLGAGLDDLLPSSGMPSASSSHQSGRLKKILSGLRADGEEGKQVEALTQLCEMLSIGTEESLSTFSVDSFVPVLVGLLNHESNPDIMLLAARAITHLCDVLPSSCAAVVHYGAVQCFVARLLTIEYMDLAEQSLQALKKISQEHPTACLRAGALMAVLSYLDFFSTGVQRVALSTAANMCKKLPSDAADFVMEAVPLLTNLLQYHDAKVLEHASVCLTRIAETFASSPDKLDELCNHRLGLIRLLSTFASGSPLGAKTLLLLGISGILKDILSGSGVSANSSVPPALSRPAEQIFEIVNLANELLPPLPQGTISLPASSNMFVKGPVVKKSPSSSSGKQDDLNGNLPEVSAREKLLKDQPELLQQFGIDLLPVLIQIYGSSVNSPVRHKCLSVIGKLMYFSSAEMIQSLLSVTNISSFLAGVLAWKDPHVLVPALQIAEILMEKLPGTFSKMFVREGVVHAVDQLILSGNPNTTPTQVSSAEKDNDYVSGTSSRSRRYKRRSGNLNSEGNTSEESKNFIPTIAGSPPSSIEVPMVNTNLRLAVSACAKTFKDKYFPSDPGASEIGVTDDLLELKNLCMKLNVGVDDQKTKAKGKSKASGSLVVDSSANKEEERISDGNLPKLRQQALIRFKLFVALALPSSLDEGSSAPLTVLVQKLQNALSSLERFPVVLSHSSRSSGGSARLSSGLSALSQPFKLRLCRAQGEKSLRDYSSNVVLIDPLANLAAVEDFLWPRVQRCESGQKPLASVGNSESGTTPTGAGGSSPSISTPSTTCRHSSRSRSSVNIGDVARKEPLQVKSTSSSKGKGKAVLKTAQEEAKGPQTRNAARRRAALDKDAQMKSVNGDSSSEVRYFVVLSEYENVLFILITDEELDISPVEIDDALVLRDDSLPVCIPEKVHDVKLGDAPEDSSGAPAANDGQTNPPSGSSSRVAAVRGSDSTDFRGGSSYASRGAMSFVLLLWLAFDNLSGHPTQLVLDEDDDERYAGSDFISSDGSRLWSDIYTITYQRADGQTDRVSIGGSSSTTTSRSAKMVLVI